jgi:hypothetical protein
MATTKPEETFHKYLRQHFEKVSQDRVRKFAEQGLVPERRSAASIMAGDYVDRAEGS